MVQTPPTRESGGADPAVGERPSAAEVVAYLRSHPDFLARRPELFAELLAPTRHVGGGIVDMQRYIIERLQQQIAEAGTREQGLVTAGRSNLSSQGRVHAAVLALLEARSFEELIERVATDLARLLDVDVAVLCIEAASGAATGASAAGVQVIEPGEVDRRLGPGHDCLLNSEVEADGKLFGGAATLVRSQALVRISVRCGCPAGLLALGSRAPRHFEAGQGTELLRFLADALGGCIRGWLTVPR